MMIVRLAEDSSSASRRQIRCKPDPEHVATSYVERQNLTMRTGARRFTQFAKRLSKKAENLAPAVSLHFLCYNFCRVHTTLRTTPAMYAGKADGVWTLAEIAAPLGRPIL